MDLRKNYTYADMENAVHMAGDLMARLNGTYCDMRDKAEFIIECAVKLNERLDNKNEEEGGYDYVEKLEAFEAEMVAEAIRRGLAESEPPADVSNLLEAVKAKAKAALEKHDSFHETALNVVLRAYNTFQESERDGVDYIFNIDRKEDLSCCIEGGMTADEIAHIVNESQEKTKYFYFGENHPVAELIASETQLVANLVAWLDDIIPVVMENVMFYESYRDFYAYFVSNLFDNR